MARNYSAEDAKKKILQFQQLRSDLLEITHRAQKAHAEAIEASARTVLNSNVLLSSIADDLRRGQYKVPRTFDTQALMAALYKYIHSAPVVETCSDLSREYNGQIDEAIRALQTITSALRRLFAGSKAREAADRGYNTLSSIASGEYIHTIRQAQAAIKRIDAISPSAAFDDYEGNVAKYFLAFSECCPNAINVQKPLSQALPLVARHQALLAQYNDAQACIDQKLVSDQHSVQSCANKALAVNVMKQLRTFEVESLSQRRSGIRVKALRDAGYNTIEDIYCATVFNLASVHGISEDTAGIIKAEARKMAEDVQKTTKLKISADERTPEVTNLLTALYACMQDKRVLDAAEAISNSSKAAIKGGDTFQRLSNVFSWLFLSDADRKYYTGAYRSLSDLIDSDYPRAVAAFHAQASKITHYNSNEVWDYFSNHSIEYFNLLEQLVPGILGNDDTLYGLPEDLAREIQDQTFFPQGLKVTLRRYQEWGVKYILHQERVLLGDEMGLGKTVQALGSMVSLRNTGATHFLVVCPASVLPNWCKEIDRKSEFRATKIHGSNRQSAIEEWMKSGGVAVTTYETTSLVSIPDDFRYDLLVVDEAHYIKNVDARRSKSVRELSNKARRILFMTGTALENRVDEMISLIDVLRPVLANRIRSIAFMSSAPQFREQIAPVYYRRKREDVLTELPDVIENEELCVLLKEEEALYEKAVLSKHQTGIRRVSWTIPDLNHSSKALRMREIISEAEDDGRKVLVFSFYRDTLKAISGFLGDRCTQIINGSVPVERRQEIIDEFEDMPAGSVLLAQIGAGGTGLNIQAASVVIICEPQLKPSTENQAIARAHRMGQSRNVLVYKLLAADTIDERIEDMLKEKQAIFDAFADKSAAADATELEENQIDDKTLGKLILDEINRINEKNGSVQPVTVEVPVDKSTADNISSREVFERSTDIPVSKESTTQPAVPAPHQTTFPSIDAFVQYLRCEGIPFIDNRPKSGCLWISADALRDAKDIQVNDDHLRYSKAAKALHGAAGWYIS